MGLFGKKNKSKNIAMAMPEVYDEADFDSVDAHITKYFGESSSVLHELVSPDIHVDIYICDPTEERPYYVLVTHGMGAHRMNVPKELEEYELDRMELMICLPKDWELNSDDERWYWPIRWLKILARLPIEHDTWLGHHHTVPSGEPFADNTAFECILLTMPYLFDEDAVSCDLPGGGRVLFYQMTPLYESEMNYKIENGAEELEELFGDDLPGILDINRENVV